MRAADWGTYNIASLWVGIAVCIPTYMLAASLVGGGMNWWQALLTIMLGNLIVCVPMVLIATPARVRDPVPGARARVLRRPRLERARHPDARARGVRLVRDPDLDRRPGASTPCSEVAMPGSGSRPSRPCSVALVLLFWALEHVHRGDGARVDQFLENWAAPFCWSMPASRCSPGRSARRRLRADCSRQPEQVRDHRRVPGLLRAVAHRDGRLLGDAGAQHPGPVALSAKDQKAQMLGPVPRRCRPR